MTKEKILVTAFELFTTRSYSKVSIDDIASEAGISKGGVFHYFPSKYALARDSIFHFFETFHPGNVPDVFTEALTKDDASERVHHIIDMYLELVEKNPLFMRFFIDVFEEAMHNKDDMKDWMSLYDQFVNEMTRLMEICEIPRPETRAQLLLATLDAVGMQSVMMPQDEKFPWDEIKEEIFNIYVGDITEQRRNE